MLFNTEPALWRAELPSAKAHYSHLYVNDHGSIWRVPTKGTPERIGQFDTTEAAVTVLVEAGWIKRQLNVETIYTAT